MRVVDGSKSSIISIHALLAESDFYNLGVFCVLVVFLSTLSLRRATKPVWFGTIDISNFYPRSPCGERPVAAHVGRRKLKFLSTLSLRRATLFTLLGNFLHYNFYPRSPCGERQNSNTHSSTSFIHFYPRSPCGERLYKIPNQREIYQYFYPRSPCGERLHAPNHNPCSRSISIHALLAESDLSHFRTLRGLLAFLSTLSLRRATKYVYIWYTILVRFLSTLSLRRATTKRINRNIGNGYFYPRSPCGERPPSVLRHCTTYLFLSTLSLRRATHHRVSGRTGLHKFLSTLSLRRATPGGRAPSPPKAFLSTLSLRRATYGALDGASEITLHFYPRSPCGERPLFFRRHAAESRHFYPRSPCGERRGG